MKIYEVLYKKISLSDLKKYTYAISSCQVDELCCIKSPEKISQLVNFLFTNSDKKKLKDHIEIMASETLYYLGIEKDLDYFDPKYRVLLKINMTEKPLNLSKDNMN